jgi:hypothetical protein
MKKWSGILVLVFILSVTTEAQYVRFDSTSGQYKPPQPYNFMNHVSFGGNFGLQFGQTTIVALSPLMNYHFTSSIVIGAGPIYQYYKIEDPYYGASYSGSIYGGRVVALAYLPGSLSKIFLMGEYDVINIPYFDTFTYEYSRTTLTIPLVGGGYRQPVGDKMFFTLAALWDLSGSQLSPYTNPIIEAGFDVGF